MLRLLVLALIVVLVYLLIQALLRKARAAIVDAARRAQEGAGGGPTEAARPVDRLVACAACGVRVPARRALPAPGGGSQVYCSEACRSAAGDRRTAAS